MNQRFLGAIGLITIGLVLGAPLAFAQISASNPVTLTNPLSCQNLSCVANNVAGFLQYLALAIAVIMVLVGAFQMITAGGDPEKFSKGRKTLLYTAVGVVVVIIAGGFVQIIQSLLG